MSTTAPLIRVCRKRTADPHSGLLVCVKRARGEEGGVEKEIPLVYSLLATQDDPRAPVENAKIIDYSRPVPIPSMDVSGPGPSDIIVQEVDETVEGPLAHLISAVGEVGDSRPSQPPPSSSAREVITCNGVPMNIGGGVPISGEDDLVYDFYEMTKGNVEDAEEGKNMRMLPISQDEVNFWMTAGEDSDDEVCADDDEDSNEEDNWRNDYPDEESGSDEDDDTYSDDSELGDPSEDWEGLGMHRLRIADRDEIGGEEYGGESTEDDEECAT